MDRSLPILFAVLIVVAGGCGRESAPASPAKSTTIATTDDEAGPWFAEVTAASGLGAVRHAAVGADSYFFPAIMSPGVALLDYDQDGDLDILFAAGCEPPAILQKVGVGQKSVPSVPAAERTNRLFRQQEPWRFEEVTASCGLDVPIYAMGVAVADVNNDGWPDLYFTGFGGDRLFVNEQGLRFTDRTEAAGIANQRWSTAVAAFDYDRDGWLDLFVVNYVDYDPARPCLIANGSQDFCNPALFDRTAAKLYRNVTAAKGGEARAPVFEDVSLTAGIAGAKGAGLGATCADFNRDGWLDVYVSNDGHGNFLWINQHNGTFSEEAVLRGVAYDLSGRGQGSMGLAVEDLNADGVPDIFVTNLDGENNALYLSQPGDAFEESSHATGLGEPSFPYTGFGTAWLDVDCDGDLDGVVANGRVRRAASALPHGKTDDNVFWSRYAEMNHLYWNDGHEHFRPVVHRADGFLGLPMVSRALAVGDIDNDGRLDLAVTIDGGPLRLLQNVTRNPGRSFRVQLRDPRFGGRHVPGAVVTVHAGERRWSRLATSSSSYLAVHDPRLHFGVGAVDTIDFIHVVWDDGVSERFPGGTVSGERVLERGLGTPP